LEATLLSTPRARSSPSPWFYHALTWNQIRRPVS
jgi:hypothetical protein